MASIAYHDAPRQAQPHSSLTRPDEALVRQFWDEAKRQVVTGDYLRRRWLPRQGHRFYTLIKVLRGYCSYSIKQGEAPCFPSYETIAKACHVSRRTICTWMARDEQGRFTHPKHGEALNRFVAVQPRRRYDPIGQRQMKTSNLYLVRMDDPVTPEDEALVWEKATDLAICYLKQQQAEQECEARRRKVDEAVTCAAPFVERDSTLNNGQKLHAQSSAETAQDRLSSTPLFTSDPHRSQPGEELRAPAIGNTRTAVKRQANKEGCKEDAASAALKSTSNSATAQHPEDLFRHAALLNEEAERLHEEREQALAVAAEAAGGVIASLLEELGDTNAAGGTRMVLTSLVAAGAHPEQMADLAYLARDRVRAFVLRGGRILDTQVGFYITTLCNLAKEARRKGWNLEQIAAADRRRHERAIRQGEHPRAAQTTPQQARCPARGPARWPMPAEAEELELDLGQREETYSEVQVQAHRQQKARLTREARQAAARQQADLFRQLAQANEVLQQSPVGCPAWERAQREKQEIERRIAALRQPAPESVPQGNQPSSQQKPPAAPGLLAWCGAWKQLSYRDQVLRMAQALSWPAMWGTLADKPSIWRERFWRLLWNSPQTTAQQIYEAYEWLRPHFQAETQERDHG